MSRLYPSLDEKFKSEGICPICLMEMAYSPRFSCDSDHVICQRCRPYYFNCPQCLQQLHEIPPQSPRPNDLPRENFMPRPLQLSHPYLPSPSAPSLDNFHEHEQHSYWDHQPMPKPYYSEEPKLVECSYSHLGCTAKFVTALRDMHVSRCQYKLHDEAHLTQVSEHEDEYIPCRYQTHGCNVRLPHWRLKGHEKMCIYKDREPSPPPSSNCCFPNANDDRGPCKYQAVGCNVQLPHWRLHGHEEICIYKDRESSSPSVDCSLPSVDDNRVSCRYQSAGCNVYLTHFRMPVHEEMCIYKDREPSPLSLHCGLMSAEGVRVSCKYQSVGCNVRLPHERLHNHEEICIYKDRLKNDQVSVEELGQHLQGSFHIHEDPYRMVGCRYQALGCNSRMPLWRQEIHETQCNYRE